VIYEHLDRFWEADGAYPDFRDVINELSYPGWDPSCEDTLLLENGLGGVLAGKEGIILEFP